MATVHETLQVSGSAASAACMRLASTLEGHEGLEAANANLMGQVQLAWDDERTVARCARRALARGGFRELQVV